MPQLFSFPKPPTVPGAQPLPTEAPNRPIGQDWLSDAVDVILGGIGLENPLSSSASRATQVGGMIGAAVPMFGMAKAATAARAVAPTLEAGRAMEAAAPAMEAAPKSITAYHGSPHDFDQFSLSKIGTGEGAQAYGHGLYFAENEGIARGYRDALTDKFPLKINGQPIPTSNSAADVENTAAGWVRMAAQQGADDPFDAAHRMAMSGWDDPKTNQNVADVIANWKRQGVTVQENPGKMYNVRINADPEHFLDWDKPISEQPAVIRDLVAQRWKGQEAFAPRTGAEIYREIGPDPEFGSGWLKERGVPGIKYLDAGSRSAGEGSRNYVVFDDHIVDILKKYGIALPFVGAAAAAQAKQ